MKSNYSLIRLLIVSDSNTRCISKSNSFNQYLFWISIIKLYSSFLSELELRKNPVIKLSIFSRFPKDIKALICDYLVTPNTSMKDQKSAVQWLLQLKEMATEVVIGEQLPIGKSRKTITFRISPANNPIFLLIQLMHHRFPCKKTNFWTVYLKSTIKLQSNAPWLVSSWVILIVTCGFCWKIRYPNLFRSRNHSKAEAIKTTSRNLCFTITSFKMQKATRSATKFASF